MVTWENLLVSFVSQAPWALVILIVVIVMNVRLRDELNGRINELGRELDGRISKLERRIDSLERLQLGIAAILVSKGLLAREEFEFIRSISEMPGSKSRYYTKADEEELRRLWSKDIDEYTEEDVEKILEIALKIRAEGVETGRRDLIDAYYMIGAFAELMKVYLLVKRMKARKAQKETSTQSSNP
jgi:cell division protein ZapA (FtsZ GTPase activity inhibitor)